MPRILVVDDERAIRNLLSMALAGAGYEVRTAGDGAEAMTLCAAERFDCVLTDVLMPSMNGHDLVRWIDSRFPTTRIALMSGYDGSGCQDCPLSRRCKLLAKPFRVHEALSFVREILAEARVS